MLSSSYIKVGFSGPAMKVNFRKIFLVQTGGISENISQGMMLVE